jgi:hypothetical protein
MSDQRILRLLLQAFGTMEILAFAAVVMPRSWMEVTHTWLGMGEMPQGPLVMFMIRQASYTYGMHGVSLLVLARDVSRFRPLLTLNGCAYLMAGPVFFAIDHSAGIPWWWTMGDTLACALFGLAVLWLNGTVGSPPKPFGAASQRSTPI